LTLEQAGIAFAAAFGAGAINSVAGGGTLLSFPALIWLGLPAITANATSTVALWPGSLSGAWGYRQEVRKARRPLLWLIAPSLGGGLAGALLLRVTPESLFQELVPFLVLFATTLIVGQKWLQRRIYGDRRAAHHSPAWLLYAGCFQFLVGVYGGYFGAGIGILMLAALGLLGLEDIHQMNGLKNLFAAGINILAAMYFAASAMVSWPFAVTMALGSILGGSWGAGVARRMGRDRVRQLVVAIGFGMGLALLARNLSR
jgi:uncharacterized membrane protein YfcA